MAKNAGKSALAAAQAARGRDPKGVIGDRVIERIVRNSTQEFQNFLSNNTGGNAMAAARQAVAAAPAPAQSFGGGGATTVAPVPWMNDNPSAMEADLYDPALQRSLAIPDMHEAAMPGLASLRARMPLDGQLDTGYNVKNGFDVFEDGSFSMGRPAPLVFPEPANSTETGAPTVPFLNPSPQQGFDPAMEHTLRFLGLIQ